VLRGPFQVVQQWQQFPDHRGLGRHDHRLPVPVDPLAVVGVLRLQPLQVRGALGQFLLDIRGGRDGFLDERVTQRRTGRARLARLGGGFARAGLLVGRPRAHLAGLRVEPAAIPHDDRLGHLVLSGALMVLSSHFFSSSSTISASTTSSALAEPAEPADSPAADAPSVPAACALA